MRNDMPVTLDKTSERGILARAAAAATRVAQLVGAPTVTEEPELPAGAGTPPLWDILDAAATYFRASEAVKAAQRDQRRTKKLLILLPIGRYGNWSIGRKAANRETPDLEAIRATYARLGLGPVPMTPCADSLTVTPIPE